MYHKATLTDVLFLITFNLSIFIKAKHYSLTYAFITITQKQQNVWTWTITQLFLLCSRNAKRKGFKKFSCVRDMTFKTRFYQVLQCCRFTKTTERITVKPGRPPTVFLPLSVTLLFKLQMLLKMKLCISKQIRTCL